MTAVLPNRRRTSTPGQTPTGPFVRWRRNQPLSTQIGDPMMRRAVHQNSDGRDDRIRRPSLRYILKLKPFFDTSDGSVCCDCVLGLVVAPLDRQRLDHRHDASADGRRQPVPHLDHYYEIRIGLYKCRWADGGQEISFSTRSDVPLWFYDEYPIGLKILWG
jgi:hypothetical protein